MKILYMSIIKNDHLPPPPIPQRPLYRIMDDGEYISSTSTLTASDLEKMLMDVSKMHVIEKPMGQRIIIRVGVKSKRRLGYLCKPVWYKLRKIKQIGGFILGVHRYIQSA